MDERPVDFQPVLEHIQQYLLGERKATWNLHSSISCCPAVAMIDLEVDNYGKVKSYTLNKTDLLKIVRAEIEESETRKSNTFCPILHR